MKESGGSEKGVPSFSQLSIHMLDESHSFVKKNSKISHHISMRVEYLAVRTSSDLKVFPDLSVFMMHVEGARPKQNSLALVDVYSEAPRYKKVINKNNFLLDFSLNRFSQQVRE